MLKRSLHVITHKRTRFLLLIIAVTAAVFAVSYALVEVKEKYTQQTGTTKQFQQEQTATNESLINNDKQQAIEHARKALDLAPNDFEAVVTLASLTSESNPTESKQLYARALEIAKQQDNPDVDGKSAITYWGAAGLAEQAGLTDQAKKYYQKVIDAADTANEYQQSLVAQSKEALKRLQ